MSAGDVTDTLLVSRSVEFTAGWRTAAVTKAGCAADSGCDMLQPIAQRTQASPKWPPALRPLSDDLEGSQKERCSSAYADCSTAVAGEGRRDSTKGIIIAVKIHEMTDNLLLRSAMKMP